MARNDQNEGEGSRTADEQYRRGVREHVLTHDVDQLAQEAMEALDNDDGELAEAEAIGRAKANELPQLEKKMIDVARLRDEVKVQMHLAKAEAKEMYEKLEDRWSKLVGKVGAVKDASTETAGDLKAATGLVVDELKDGYERLKRELTK